MSLHDEYIDWSLSGNCLATTGPLLDDCGDDDEILDVEETEAPWSNRYGYATIHNCGEIVDGGCLIGFISFFITFMTSCHLFYHCLIHVVLE